MNTKQLQDVLRKLVQNSRNGNRVSLLIEGVHGTGKSAIVAEVAAELGYRLADLRLGQQEVADLIGMPIVKDGHTCWAPPSWWPKEGEKVIIFLDELNRGTQDVKQAIFQLVRDFKLHTHVLPPECIVISAINPETEGYDVSPLDIALQDRFWKTIFEPTVAEWLEWAEKSGVCDSVREFIKADSIYLDPNKGEASPTRRGWERLSNALKLIGLDKTIEKKDYDLLIDTIIGNVGEAAGLSFKKFLINKYKPLDVKTLAEDYKSIKPKVQKLIDNQQMDVISRAMDDLATYLDKHTIIDEPQPNFIESVISIVQDMSLDIVVSFMRTIGSNKKLIRLFQYVCRDKGVYEQVVKTRDAINEYHLLELFPTLLKQDLQLEKEALKQTTTSNDEVEAKPRTRKTSKKKVTTGV